MSTRRGRRKEEEDSDNLPVLGEDGYGNAGGYYNNNHVSNKPPGSRAFPSGSRPGSGSRRTPTPTKQVALQAVRRKDDSIKEPFDDVDLAELNSTLKLESERSFLERENSNTDLKKGDGASGFTVKLPNGYGAKPKDPSSNHDNHNDTDIRENNRTRSVPNSTSQQKTQDSKSSKAKDSSKTEDSSDEDEDDDDDDDDWQEGGNKTAPMQLMMEFIGCLMQGDYPNAAKLCKMILMYEPNNAEALKFQPLINEKIEIDAQPDADSGSGESGSEDDNEEDEGNSDDDSDSDSDDSDDDSDASDNSSQSEAENEGGKADSGISSGLSGSNSNSEME